MYQPRRAAAEAVPGAPEAGPDAVGVATPAPRRVAASRYDGLARRGGIGVLALAAASAGGIAVLGESPAAAVSPTTDVAATSAAASAMAGNAAPLAASAALAGRDATVSRGATRTVRVRELAASKVETVEDDLASLTPLYATGTLSLRKKASEKAPLVASVYDGAKVLATSTLRNNYRKVTTEDGLTGWLLAAELSDAEPEGGVAGGLSMAPCSLSSSIEAKIRRDTILIYRSVCANFPGVNSYGGWRAGGLPFHRNGRAVDIMLTPHAESAMGWRIAHFITAHYKELNIDHVIFEQKIWTPYNQTWRHMADRGSITANHFNHVHVAVNA
ncbi:MAG TPA: hypothetical protein PLE12_10065 [Propionicimonas sp.]|nr:hypothetical protein [Propionicimonas sp.]